MKSAEESILKGNYDSKKLCWEKFLNRNAIRQAQAVTDMGLEQETIDDLKKKRKKVILTGIPMIYILCFVQHLIFIHLSLFFCSVTTASK